jgi:ABC-type multidrug transport system ATPase subunit
MKPIRYGQWQRLTDAYHGWRDGRKKIPARFPQVPAPGPVTTPHREALIRLAQDAFAHEYLSYQRLVAEAHRRITAGRARMDATRETLAWAQSAEDMESRPLTAEQVTRRRLAEDHHPEQVIVQRRQKEQHRLIARARAEVVRARADLADIEAELADDITEAQQQHQLATARVRRIHEHVHRRLAVYRRSLIRAHPDGGWANAALSLKAPEIPGWALPDAYLPDNVPTPPVLAGTAEDDEPGPSPDELPPVQIIELRLAQTHFGSRKLSDSEDCAYELLTSPLAAPWHFTIVKKRDHLELRTRNYEHGPYIGGKPVSGTAVLSPGDFFDFAEDRYTMLDLDRLRKTAIGKPNLVAADLYATSKSKVRLSSMSFVQEDQTLLAILGPSGAGKSSLFAALLGELPLESGRLFFAGLPMDTHWQQIRDQLGFVPQQTDLHMSLTVAATLNYGFGLRSPDRGKRDQAVSKALEVVKLQGKESQLLSTLSGGQLRRVSIALELLTKPPLLLLDEPTSGLDAHMDREIMIFLREYAEAIDPAEPTKRHTVIVVTHATEHLAQAHQILVVVEDGAPAYSGPPKQIRKHFGFKTYADLMSMLMDKPREWAGKYRTGTPFKEAENIADKLAQRSASEVSTLARKLGGSRPRSPWEAFAKLGVLIRRQVALLRSRAVTKNDPSMADKLKNLAVVFLPLIVAAASAVLAAFVASSPGLGGLKPSGAGPTALTLLSTLCILSGQALTYSDVVNELEVIKREYRAGVGALSVLLAKWLVYAVIAIAQAAVITLVFCAVPHREPVRSLFAGPEVNLFLSLSALSVTAMTLGLLVSTVAAKLEHAVAMVTAISITQIALNGVTSNLSKGGVFAMIGELFPDRWGLAAAASSVDLRGIDGPRVSPDALWSHTAGQWLADVAALALLSTVFFALATWRLHARLRLRAGRRRPAKEAAA